MTHLARIADALEQLARIEADRRADEIATRDARRRARPPRNEPAPSPEVQRAAAARLRKMAVR